MSAVKSNELTKRAHARVTVSRPVGVASNAFTHRFQRSLPEQAIDKRRRRRMVDHEPIVSRQRHARIGAGQRGRPNSRLTAALADTESLLSLKKR